MNKILKILPAVFLFALGSAAQEPCATDQVHAAMMATDAAYRNNINALEERVNFILKNGSDGGQRAVYIIPVVVHVIHLGEPVGTGTNIPDAQIQAAIDGINNRWRNIIGNGVDMEVQFCLATVDPNGNPSSGINRVNGSAIANYQTMGINANSPSCGGADEQAVKDLSRWPVSDYYNIWVVNSICGGWAGWAYYPFGGAYDGATICYTSMTGSAAVPAHEIGHGFFLYHTFEGDGGNSSCRLDADCTNQGDHVCDTQPHKQGDCGATNPCTGSGTYDNSRYNYMSYCSGLDRFTPGQKARVQATLMSPPRSSLLLNAICPGTGISENTKQDLVSVYPNPASDELRIQSRVLGTGLKIESVEIYDALGVNVFSQCQTSNVKRLTAINISSLAPGIYFVKLHDEKGTAAVRKIVKL